MSSGSNQESVAFTLEISKMDDIELYVYGRERTSLCIMR